MSKERYNQIINEVYTNFINKCREEVELFREQNPFVLVDYQDDTKELFIKSIKDDKHWFSGEKNFSEKWGLKIEERELSYDERYIWYKANSHLIPSHFRKQAKEFEDKYVPRTLVTLTYNNETIEVYE